MVNQSTSTLSTCCRAINRFSRCTGICLSWLVAVMVALVMIIVIGRALFASGSIGLQEGVTYLHATLFMLCMAYTLKEGGHVRVDVFYRRLDPARKAWVDAVGTIVFLFPYTGFLFFVSWDFAARAWEIREISSDAGGLPYVYLLKSIIPVAALLMAIQGVAELLQQCFTLCQRDPN